MHIQKLVENCYNAVGEMSLKQPHDILLLVREKWL